MKRKNLDLQILLELKRQSTKAYLAIYREDIHKKKLKPDQLLEQILRLPSY